MSKKPVFRFSVVFCILLVHVARTSGQSTPVNLLANPGFEMYTGNNGVADDWIVWNGAGHVAVASISNDAYEGTQSQRIDVQAVHPSGYIYLTQSQDKVQLKANTTYVFSFYAKGKGKVLPLITLNGYEYIRGWYGTVVSLKPIWQRISICFVTPDTVHSIDELIRFSDAPNFGDIQAGDWIQIDAASLVEQDTSGVEIEPTSITTLEGFGAEWDPHFWMYYNLNKGVTRADWDLILERIEQSKPEIVRISVLPSWYEPANDNQDPDSVNWGAFRFQSPMMISLYEYLDACQGLGVKVNLTVWGAPKNFGDAGSVYRYWMAFDTASDWITAPKDLEEWAESVAVLLKHLIEHRGYTIIKDVTLVNEPNGSFWNGDNVIDFSYYSEMYRVTSLMLERYGIRNRIRLVGPDDSNDYSWFQNAAQSMNDVIDIYDSHNYQFGIDDVEPSYIELLRNWVWSRTSVTPSQKKFLINEFGTNQFWNWGYIPPDCDVDTFDRGLFLAAFTTEALSSGASGASYWALHDIYYYQGNDPADGLSTTGLWRFKTQNWAPRPMYYAWTLLTRYTEGGSQVHKTTNYVPGLAVAALTSTAGELTILAVNTTAYDKDVPFFWEGHPGIVLQKYVYAENTLPSDDSIIGSIATVSLDGTGFRDTLPAKSFTVYTNLNPDKTTNRSPEIPSVPSGARVGEVHLDHTFSTATYDPDGDQVKYVFDWGDGSATATESQNSGMQVTESHAWRNAGIYNIKARATDAYDGTSRWSANFEILITSRDHSENLVANPSFEIYTGRDGVADYWKFQTSHTALPSLSDGARTGSRSQRIDIQSVSQSGFVSMLQSQTIVNLKPKMEYTLRFYARGRGDIVANAVLDDYTYIEWSTVTTLSPTWQPISVSFTTSDTVFCIDELIRFADSENFGGGVAAGDWVEIDDISLTASCVLFGDLDGDGKVDVKDIMQVASLWRCRSGDDCYDERYDLDKDGDIDIVDIMLVVVHWGENCAG